MDLFSSKGFCPGSGDDPFPRDPGLLLSVSILAFVVLQRELPSCFFSLKPPNVLSKWELFAEYEDKHYWESGQDQLDQEN